MSSVNKAYEVITQRMIEMIEETGLLPWQRPWKGMGTHKNGKTKASYRGVNALLLEFVAQKKGFSSPFWLTFNQIKDRGGFVKKGERGTPVLFWKIFRKEEEKDGEKTEKRIPVARYYVVFNVEQTEGLKPIEVPAVAPFEPIEEAERVFVNMPNRPAVNFGGDRAFYRPSEDSVTLPPREAFFSPAFFYSVAFHELGHSTGHKDRLNRKGVTELAAFGDENYSKEELVAELTAAFLCGHCNIENEAVTKDNAAYLKNWLKALKGEPRLLIDAAAGAQKAADFILGKQAKEEKESDHE